MATIRLYTDFKQSERLLEILPLESADMKWFSWKEESDAPLVPTFGYDKETAEFYKDTKAIYLPCWSLAALLSVIPEPELIKNSDKRWMLISWDKNKFPWSIGGHVDPVDACYEMILKLHEQKIL